MDGWNLLPALNPARWTIAGGFGFSFVVTALMFLGYNGDHGGAQPIAFNHSKHLESGMSCTDCHTGAETQAHATLPTIETCMNCHAATLSESPEEEKIRVLAAASKELQWTKLTRVPSHVYFSHRRHVTFGKIACATCHGPMEKATAPPTRLFRELTMDACIECHEQNRAGIDCNDCHW